MMEKSKTGLFAALAIGLAVLVMMIDNEPAQASEATPKIGHSFFQQQQANLNELREFKVQLVELGEEGSDLYLAVQNAIDTNQQLLDETTYWQSADQ